MLAESVLPKYKCQQWLFDNGWSYGESLSKKKVQQWIAEETKLQKNNDKKKKRSRYISSGVKKEVWDRDRGVCQRCGAKYNIVYDHIIPHSKGGSNKTKNIQLLCDKCNRRKSDKIE